MTPEQLRAIEKFSVACFCREGGEPHETDTGTCKWANWRPPLSTVEPAAPEPEGCAVCETETEEAIETCGGCETSYHTSCDHDCEAEA